MNLGDVVDTVCGKGIRHDVFRAGCDAHAPEPQVTLVAPPTTWAPRTDNVQVTIHTASFGAGDLPGDTGRRPRVSSHVGPDTLRVDDDE